MKAIVQDEFGSPDVLELRDIDPPVLGDDDVLVLVHAAGVDPGVWHIMRGEPYVVRLMGFGFRRPKRKVPGNDVSGRVEAVGRNVTRFQPGDEVFGVCRGSFAEYAAARQDHLVPKPANVTFEQAAAVPVSALTALQGLRDIGQIQSGQKILINGASGGVGTFAVQLAKVLGAEVTGVCSSGNVDLVRSIGADHVIDYTREDFTRTGPYDLVLDTVGNRSLSDCRRALAPVGTLVLVGGTGGPWLGGLDRTLRALLWSPFLRHRFRSFISTVRQEDLVVLAELVEAGSVSPVIDRTYQLIEVPEAIRHLEEGHARGKVVVTVQG